MAIYWRCTCGDVCPGMAKMIKHLAQGANKPTPCEPVEHDLFMKVSEHLTEDEFKQLEKELPCERVPSARRGRDI